MTEDKRTLGEITFSYMFHEMADAYFEKQQKIESLDPTKIGYSNEVAVIEANYKAKVDAIINREKYGINNHE